MANKVQLKRSATAGKVPLTTDLQLGELAINTFDGRLFAKKDNGTASIIELGAPNINRRVFTTSGQYIPSANTKAIVVYLTGGGAAGGSCNAATNTGAYGGGGGSGGGTLIFSMPANSSQTFQVTVGAATATTASTTSIGAGGSASTFGILTGSPATLTNIATAPGGVGGNSALSTVGLLGAGVSSTITAPNSTYVSASSYIGIRGGNGSMAMVSFVSTSTNVGGAQTGAGGGSFWGNGAASTSTLNGAINGASAVIFGTGGAGAAKVQKSTSSLSATGGAGAQGVCVILEITN